MTGRAGDTPIAHGYILGDLNSLARLAVHTVGPMGMDWHERYDIAYSAIAEYLYAAESAPSRRDLVRTGQLAIYAVVTDDRHHHGYYKHKTIGGSAGPGSSPAFARYWCAFGTATPSPEQAIVERVAIEQILPALTEGQRDALVALAVLDNYHGAAAHLGVLPSTYKSTISRARKVFFALWHEGETPYRPRRTDRRVGSYSKDQDGGEQ